MKILLKNQLLVGQQRQTELIQTLHKNSLADRTKIDNLIVTQNELKEELDNLKRILHSVNIISEHKDMEINTIIQAWRHKNNWPIKYNTLRCFSVQDDLAKVRKHRSDKHQHVPVRIDKTANNKTGDKACVLCSDSKDRRRSKWMCSTCEVPLCTRVILGEEGGSRSHHDLWHSAKDIMEEHKRCHQMLLDSRENKKKLAKTGNDADDIDSDSDVEETTS